MGRFRDSQTEDKTETAIDMSPLIDCVFILLIFFIVTTVFVKEPGVDVSKPRAASAAQLEKTSILIALTATGEVVYGGRNIGIQGIRPLVRRLVLQDDIPVIIQADSSSDNGLLVNVVEEAKLGGATKVSLATSNG